MASGQFFLCAILWFASGASGAQTSRLSGEKIADQCEAAPAALADVQEHIVQDGLFGELVKDNSSDFVQVESPPKIPGVTPRQAGLACPESWGDLPTWQISLDVIIVGAGHAGTRAAWRILEEGAAQKVLILEANGRVGGRTRNLALDHNFHVTDGVPDDGNFDQYGDDIIEVGGTWLAEKHHEAISWAGVQGVQLYDSAGIKSDLLPADGGPALNDDDKAEEGGWPWWYWALVLPDKVEEKVSTHKTRVFFDFAGTRHEFSQPDQFLATISDSAKNILELFKEHVDVQVEILGCDDSQLFNSGTPDQQSVVTTLDGNSCAEYFEIFVDKNGKNEVGRAEATLIWRMIVKAHFAIEPTEVSMLLFVLTHMRDEQCGNLAEGNEYAFRVRGGAAAFAWNAVKKMSIDDRFCYLINHPAVSIQERQAEARPSFTIAAGRQTFTAKSLLLTGTPIAMNKILKHKQSTKFPEDRGFGRFHKVLQEYMPMANAQKYMFKFSHPWWRNREGDSFLGHIMALRGPADADNDDLNIVKVWIPWPEGPATPRPMFDACVDHSPYKSTAGDSPGPGVLACFVDGDASTQFRREQASKRKDIFFKWLNHAFCVPGGFKSQYCPINEGQAEFNSAIDWTWMDQPYFGGAYSAVLKPGVLGNPDLRNAWMDPQKAAGIFVAGTEYELHGFAYIDGALRSGIKAADKIAAYLKRLEA